MRKNLIRRALILMGVLILATSQAEAGCLKGPIVGGIAGHFVGHGGVGAAAGCAYGARRSKQDKAAREKYPASGAETR